jgi:hypothetical protein
LIVSIAGKGDLESDCKDSIIQLDKSNDTSLVSDTRASGISVKRLEERFSERSVVAMGAKLFAEIDVKELSASDKYFSRCHLFEGKMLRVSKLEVLSLRWGCTEYSLEFELPEPVRFALDEYVLMCRYEVLGRGGLGRLGETLPDMGFALSANSSRSSFSRLLPPGEPGSE